MTGDSKDDIVHVPAEGQALPRPGEAVRLSIDWERRYRLMRMHTACHLLSVVCPYPVTGAAVGEEESRIDFDIPDSGVTKEEVTRQIMELVAADHPVFTRLDHRRRSLPPIRAWSSPRTCARRPAAVVIRLVCIGDDASVDSQPCGGTHVRSTGEVGAVHIGKIEKKGRENRRFRLRFGPLPET